MLGQGLRVWQIKQNSWRSNIGIIETRGTASRGREGTHSLRCR